MRKEISRSGQTQTGNSSHCNEVPAPAEDSHHPEGDADVPEHARGHQGARAALAAPSRVRRATSQIATPSPACIAQP